MRPNKNRRTGIILYGLLLIPLLFTAAALAQATEQAQGLAEITAVLSEILHTPSMLRWCASTPKFLLAVLVLLALAAFGVAWYLTGGDLAALPQRLKTLRLPEWVTLWQAHEPKPGARLI